jgi:hypothetical protein
MYTTLSLFNKKKERKECTTDATPYLRGNPGKQPTPSFCILLYAIRVLRLATLVDKKPYPISKNPSPKTKGKQNAI